MRRFGQLITVIGVVLVIALGFNWAMHRYQASQADPVPATTPKKTTTATQAINWRAPSEDKPYPNLKEYPKAWLDVDTAAQRVYVKTGQRVLYIMYCSTGTGKANATPKGTYHIQAERGTFFYNQASGEGAKDWVSWKDHGIYLFHSVPTDKDGHFIESEAQELGKRAASHGCVRLSVADAHWVYTHVPEGMKVVIH